MACRFLLACHIWWKKVKRKLSVFCLSKMSGSIRQTMKHYITLLFLIWTTSNGLIGQSLAADVFFLDQQLETKDLTEKYYVDKSETNELKLGVQFFFLFYKNFLSSQDNQNCSFSPTCSTYCLHSIRSHGVVKGLMGAFDRLTRCNYLSPENYEIDFDTGRLLDPVDEE